MSDVLAPDDAVRHQELKARSHIRAWGKQMRQHDSCPLRAGWRIRPCGVLGEQSGGLPDSAASLGAPLPPREPREPLRGGDELRIRIKARGPP